MHQNSLAAYRQGTRELSTRAAQIMAWVLTNGPHTDREVAAGLGFHDLNAVRPRITELVAAGLLCELRNAKDDLTGKTVRVVSATAATLPVPDPSPSPQAPPAPIPAAAVPAGGPHG
ncbi:MAG: hypothetical protein NTW87_20995 [Planctomycetota bacterium]|nr:hypothetical protein [Planctomycetota bacterium]